MAFFILRNLILASLDRLKLIMISKGSLLKKGCFRGQEIVARMKYLGVDRRKFCTFIANNDFLENDLIKILGKIITIDDKKVFNGIIKKDDVEKVKRISEIISIL